VGKASVWAGSVGGASVGSGASVGGASVGGTGVGAGGCVGIGVGTGVCADWVSVVVVDGFGALLTTCRIEADVLAAWLASPL
jgi:hypothetical protein